MGTLLNVSLDVLLGLSVIVFGYALLKMMLDESDGTERFYQSLALAAGAITALGAQASNAGFATYTVNSLTKVRPGGGAFVAVSVIVPGGVAALFGWYGVRLMRKSSARGRRLMAFLGMLTAVAFAEIFAIATKTKGVELGAAAIPNASFVVGLALSVIFLAPAASDETPAGPAKLPAIGGLFRNRLPLAARLFPDIPPAPARSRGSWADD